MMTMSSLSSFFVIVILLLCLSLITSSSSKFTQHHNNHHMKGLFKITTFHLPSSDKTGSLSSYDLIEFEVEDALGGVVPDRVELTCPSNRREPYDTFKEMYDGRFRIENENVPSRVAAVASSISGSTFHIVSLSSLNRKSTWDSCILRIQINENDHILVTFTYSSSSSFEHQDDGTTSKVFLEYMNNLNLDHTSTACIQVPKHLLNDENSMSLIEEKLGVQHRAKSKMILDGLMGMLKPIFDPIMTAINPLLSAVFGAILGPGFKSSMGGPMGPEFVDMVPRLLNDDFMATLAPSLIGPVSEAASASLGESLIASLRSYLTHGMTERVSSELVPKLFRTLVKEIPPEVEARTSKGIAERVTVTLTHILVRSLTHSVAPALVHTITHNPMQDYYCYYCYHHGVYCSYCHYAPLQVYYTQYYSAYYSAYYADYYSKWVSNEEL